VKAKSASFPGGVLLEERGPRRFREELENRRVRLTTAQNFVVLDVAEAERERLAEVLAALDLTVEPSKARDLLVSCDAVVYAYARAGFGREEQHDSPGLTVGPRLDRY
jgi:hypothetical protein